MKTWPTSPAAASRRSASSIFSVVAERRAADRAGRGAQVGRSGDRGEAGLGRAVEVVEDVAERVHERGRQVEAEQRRAGGARPRAARRCRSAPGPRAAAQDPLRASPAPRPERPPRCRSIAASVASGSKRRRRTTGEPSSRPSARKAKPKPWKSGGPTRIGSPARSARSSRSSPAGPSAALGGGLRGAPFGDAGRARGEDHQATALWRTAGFAAGPLASSSRLGPGAPSSCQAPISAPSNPEPSKSGANSSSWTTAPGRSRSSTLAQLRGGEVGVEQQQVGAEARRRRAPRRSRGGCGT